VKVLLVSSWGTACGIAEFGAQLAGAVHTADPSVTFIPCPEGLDPASVPATDAYDMLFLNFHLGLHSRWTVGHIQTIKAQGNPIVVDFHDTRGECQPDARAQSLHDVADRFIVHEPCEGLPKQILIRQGVPSAEPPKLIEYVHRLVTQDKDWPRFPYNMPILGTAGFNFPWKSFDQLAEVTAASGWGYLVCSNNATDEDVARWTHSNPWTFVVRGYQPTSEIVAWLTACDATCWAYQCANTGTSGAIRLGLAARKPVIAWRHCRQFRDLYLSDPNIGFLLTSQIDWCESFSHLPIHLEHIPIQRVSPGIVAIAHRDSWVKQGKRYAEIFQSLA
jgi:hypothetical protein